MNEMRFPEAPPPTSTPPPVEPAQPPSEGSLALGVGLAWLIYFVGSIVFAILGMWLFARPGAGAVAAPLVVLGAIPLLATIALATWMTVKGPRRTGIGIFIGIGSVWAVQLLLVAACFGIIFALSGH